MTNDILEYKGYHTKVEFDAATNELHGKIINIDDLVTFEADDLKKVKENFQAAVDDYIAFCTEVGKNPCKEYKGTFNVRIQPELHKKIAEYALCHGTSLNSMIERSVDYYLRHLENDH